MFGLGGIFTEALKDVTFRVAPLTREDALEMIDEIKTKKLLGEFRGISRSGQRMLWPKRLWVLEIWESSTIPSPR